MYYECSNSVSEQLFDLVLLIYDFPFKYDLVEVVVFKLVNLYPVLLFQVLIEFEALRGISLWESNLV